jgi:hypothetical protein
MIRERFCTQTKCVNIQSSSGNEKLLGGNPGSAMDGVRYILEKNGRENRWPM